MCKRYACLELKVINKKILKRSKKYIISEAFREYSRLYYK